MTVYSANEAIHGGITARLRFGDVEKKTLAEHKSHHTFYPSVPVPRDFRCLPDCDKSGNLPTASDSCPLKVCV